jgi:hypothetical protein
LIVTEQFVFVIETDGSITFLGMTEEVLMQ